MLLLTQKFKVDDLAPGDRGAFEALEKNDVMVRAVPWAVVHDLLPYHQDTTPQAPSTLLPHRWVPWRTAGATTSAS